MCKGCCAELPVFGGHTFRHTFATRCLEAGVKPKTIQSYLGHATLEMTMNLYVHTTDNVKQEEIELLDMKDQGFTELALCGLDECGCVGATAKGAVKAGLKVKMLTDSIGRRFPEKKVKAMRDELLSLGVEYI